MKNNFTFSIVLVTSIFFGISSCADKLPAPSTSLDCNSNTITYNQHVKNILEAKCNLAGCHDDSNLTSFGDFSSLSDARKTSIFDRVCVQKNMPPAGMSAALVDTIRCWSENNYLEN